MGAYKILANVSALFTCEEVKHIEWINLNMRGHIDEMKQCNDYLTHRISVIGRNRWHNEYLSRIEPMIKKYGLMSIQVQSVMKMVVDMEWSSEEVKRRARESGELPPAFNKSLIAVPDSRMSKRGDMSQEEYDLLRSVDKFVSETWSWESLPDTQKSKHPNLDRLIKLMSRYYRRYMRKLRPRMYVLRNGSSTAFTDQYNIYDINGVVYMTPEESDAVDTRWNAIIEHFMIKNFSEDNTFIEQESKSTYGTVNCAPDDSGKTRISFCIDPCVQVISKAIAKCFDYVSRKIGNNCTKDQQRVIRNILKKNPNHVISTDMSKYSDTLQIKYILAMLRIIGVPCDVLAQMEDLFTLPMHYSILGVDTGRTSASYQGQYADFSLITMMNIWIQCCIFDFVGEYYDMTSTNCTSGAVGDDTVMSFWHEHRFLFSIVKCAYNCVGVNINKSKTHEMHYGKGYIDFIKRIVTRHGLVPYFRLIALLSDNRNDHIEEALRFCRDNLIDNEEDMRKYLLWLSESEMEFLVQLHPICGGVIDRPITERDLAMYQKRQEMLGHKYRVRASDDIRHWIDKMHAEGLMLYDTCLIGFVENWEDYFDDPDSWSEVDEWGDLIEKPVLTGEDLENEIVDKILNCYSYGYEDTDISCLFDLIGLTWAQIQHWRQYEKVKDYLNSYLMSETYRYHEKRARKIDVYDRLMSYKDLSLEEVTVRCRSFKDMTAKGIAQDRAIGRHALELIKRQCSKYGWLKSEYVYYQTKEYLCIPNHPEYRLYGLYSPNCRSRSVIPYEIFKVLLRGHCVDEDHYAEVYELFLSNLPYPDTDARLVDGQIEYV